MYSLEAVEGPAQREGFPSSLVDDPKVEAAGGVKHTGVGSVGRSIHQQKVNGGGPYPFHSEQSEAKCARWIDREWSLGLVDVGPQHGKLHAPAFLHKERHLLNVIHVVGQHGRHVLCRVVGLEVGSLVGDPGVAGGVRFVECVRSKGLPVLPNLFENGFGMPALDSALHKLGLHLVEYGLNLFAHRLAKHVGLTLCKAGQLLRQQHHLLLVDRDSVGLAKVVLHVRQVVGDGLGSVLAANKARNVLNRPRAVQGVHGDQVAKHRRLEVLEVLLHPGRFVLKDADGVSALKELVGGGVVERNRLNINVNSVALANQLNAVFDQRKRFQAQEVHLEKARRLDDRVVKLRRPHRAVLGRGHRNQLANVTRCDNDPAGVNARVAQRALEHLGLLERRRFEVVALGHLAQRHRLVVVFVAELFTNRGIV